MARDLFIDLTNNRLAASETNLAPSGNIALTKGDTGAWNLYFLKATGQINSPFVIVDKSSASVKLGIGSRTGTPTSGTWSLAFGGDTAFWSGFIIENEIFLYEADLRWVLPSLEGKMAGLSEKNGVNVIKPMVETPLRFLEVD